MSNSPRYVGFTSPPYNVTLVDDTGQRIDLTGADTSLFSWRLQNLTTQTTHMGGGAWVITDAVNGEAAYYLTLADVAVAGSCLVFVTIQLPSDASAREFDPDPLIISVGSGSVSPAPIPLVQVSGYVAPIYLVDSAGTNKASVSSGGALKVDNSGVVQPVSGTITVNAGTNLNTSLLALESGGNLAALKTDADSIVTNTTGLATQATLAAAKTDLDSVVTNTSNTATNTSSINTHAANIDTATSASKTDLDTIVTQTSNVAKETGGHLASIDTSTAASKTDLDSIVTNTSHIPTVGQKAMASSTPVAIASDQSNVPISGSVTATQTTGSNLHTVVDSGSVTANAGTGTYNNQQSNVQTDYDTGASTQNMTMFGVALPASGGAVAGGTSSNPLRTDPTGTTTQPISGTVTVQQTTASSLKVDLSGTAANATAIKVDGSGVTQPVSLAGGSITANAGTNLNTSLLALESGGNLASIATNTSNTATNTNNINTHISNIDTATAASKTDLDTIATNSNKIPSLGQSTKSGSVPVTIASDQDALLTTSANSVSNSNGPGGGTLDLMRSLQGKGLQSVVLSYANPGDTYVVLASTPPVSLKPGIQVILTGGASAEAFYVTSVQGTTVSFSTALVNSGQTTLLYDSFSVLGPATSGFTAIGIPPHSKALWNTTNQLYYTQTSNQPGVADVAPAGVKIITGSANALNAYLIPDTDVSSYKFLSIHITGTYSGTISFFGANDNTVVTWPNLTMFRADALNQSTSGFATSSTNIIFCTPLLVSHFRAQMISYTSGTATCTMVLSCVPPPAWLFTQQTILQANVQGGAICYHKISTANDNAAVIKNTTGQIYGYDIANFTGSWRYVKFYNKTSTPAPSTDTVIRTVSIPPNGKASRDFANGIAFSSGIGIAAVANLADNDDTAIGAGDLDIEVEWR